MNKKNKKPNFILNKDVSLDTNSIKIFFKKKLL